MRASVQEKTRPLITKFYGKIVWKIRNCIFYFLFKSDGHFFRKGKVGDWLEKLNMEDSIRIDEMVENKLKYKNKIEFGIDGEDLKRIYDANMLVKKNQ